MCSAGRRVKRREPEVQGSVRQGNCMRFVEEKEVLSTLSDPLEVGVKISLWQVGAWIHHFRLRCRLLSCWKRFLILVRAGKCEHTLSTILFCTLCAVLCGAEGWPDVGCDTRFCKRREELAHAGGERGRVPA